MSELETIVQGLEARRHRVTPARLTVLAAVLNEAGHFTIEDVLRKAPQVGRATVFRTIKLLCELGIVCRVLLEDGSLHYRLSRRGHHHHLVCVSCGAVQDMDECAIGDFVREMARTTGYHIQGHWLEFYGRCGNCASSRPEAGAQVSSRGP